MCADIGILTGLFFMIRFLVKAGFSGGTVLALLFVILTALAGLGCAALLRFAEKRYREIEV
jgi:type III secretory pathway component EscS